MAKVALITGITGQDGSYLAEFLLEKGYLVRGIVRRSSNSASIRYDHLLEKYENWDGPGPIPFLCKYADLTDAISINNIIEEFQPDEIYNLAAQSHVGISFENPESTININTLGALRILECLKRMKKPCKYYQASSSEMFGATPPPQSETTKMMPQSPYGVAKLAAFHLTRIYREGYNLFAANGILFNHESPRRGINFVTRKITTQLARIIVGEVDKIVLGNLDAKRDWGFSGEYVQAMWHILQQETPDDFVIATNETHTVRDFIEEAFDLLGLDYNDFMETNDRYKRPAEVPALLGDPTKALKVLKWEPKVKFKELTRMMVVADVKSYLQKAGIVPMNENVTDEQVIEKARELAKGLAKNTRA